MNPWHNRYFVALAQSHREGYGKVIAVGATYCDVECELRARSRALDPTVTRHTVERMRPPKYGSYIRYSRTHTTYNRKENHAE